MHKRIGYSGGQVKIRKADPEAETLLDRLRSFLDVSEPEIALLLVRMWRTQGNAITYKELRTAILNGEISADYFEEWQQDYSVFVQRHLAPAWKQAMESAVSVIKEKHPDWHYDPMADGVREWTEAHGAEFVTRSTSDQIAALRTMVQRAAVLEDISVDQLARMVRPVVGLTQQQATANLNYFHTLIDNGVSKKKATDLSIRYAAKQHRYRGYNIARTELAFAYNQGSYQGTKQAQAAGYIGDVEKVWCTADDERVCPICGALEGVSVAMDEDFNFQTKLIGRNPTIRRVPPAHPSCRCAVLYREITPPVL